MKKMYRQCYYIWTLGFLMLPALVLNGQDRYLDKKGVIVFEASEELFEEVKAKSESVTAIFDVAKK
ncbi:MAG TPA: hypothetical protein VFM69_05180, partial [Pricia sp.]|nr:hypothetical protein [Pricia sp.]